MANLFVEDAPIYSSLAADPMMAELVEMYVDETSEKIAAMQGAFASGDRDKLRGVAHQMKGAAGSYGFDQVTAAAAALETAVRDAQPAETVQSRFDELIGLCRRIRSGIGPIA